jgi:hypothetical protein
MMNRTVVFEDDRGNQVLLTTFIGESVASVQIAARPDRDATWGPPLRPVMVDGQKVDAGPPHIVPVTDLNDFVAEQERASKEGVADVASDR